MRRDIIAPREGWQDKVEALGFGFHTIDGQAYWREDACYVFDEAAVDTLEAATAAHAYGARRRAQQHS